MVRTRLNGTSSSLNETSSSPFNFEMKGAKTGSNMGFTDLDERVREILKKSTEELSNQSEGITSRYESGISILDQIKPILKNYNTNQAEGMVLMGNLIYDWQQLERNVKRMTETPELLKELEDLKDKVFSVRSPLRLAVMSPRTIANLDESKFGFKTWKNDEFDQVNAGSLEVIKNDAFAFGNLKIPEKRFSNNTNKFKKLYDSKDKDLVPARQGKRVQAKVSSYSVCHYSANKIP